jgi:hypothetical protein
MNQGKFLVVVMLGVVGLLVSVMMFRVIGQPFTVKAQEPKQFQYKIVEVLRDTQNMQTILNEYGASGWELVTVAMGEMTEPRLIFKK